MLNSENLSHTSADQMCRNNCNASGEGDIKVDEKYFKVECQPLLLPDEYCLAEDDEASFDLHAEKAGFNLLRPDLWFMNITAKIYLTNYRVITSVLKNFH